MCEVGLKVIIIQQITVSSKPVNIAIANIICKTLCRQKPFMNIFYVLLPADYRLESFGIGSPITSGVYLSWRQCVRDGALLRYWSDTTARPQGVGEWSSIDKYAIIKSIYTATKLTTSIDQMIPALLAAGGKICSVAVKRLSFTAAQNTLGCMNKQRRTDSTVPGSLQICATLANS